MNNIFLSERGVELIFCGTFKTKGMMGQMGNFNEVRVLKVGIFGEIINNLNFLQGSCHGGFH